jgi:hypothetical protein
MRLDENANSNQTIFARGTYKTGSVTVAPCVGCSPTGTALMGAIASPCPASTTFSDKRQLFFLTSGILIVAEQARKGLWANRGAQLYFHVSFD